MMRQVQVDALIERYSVILLDAYGVLVNSEGALPGAAALLRRLNTLGKAFFIVTNDATKPPEIAARRYQGFGLAVAPSQIISSGSLLEAYFRDHGLVDRKCRVLGPPGSLTYVIQAGGRVAEECDDFEVVVVADQEGFPFLETVDTVLSGLFARVDAGKPVHLVLPNPDLIYPKPSGYGITSGSIALLLEAALGLRSPGRSDLRFTALGKPQPTLFMEAQRRCGHRDMVMIGDQVATDIAGAKAAGIDAALLLGGVSGRVCDLPAAMPRPDYILASLAPGAQGG